MIIPWSVDVPVDRYPVMNWLIITATVVVFGLQQADFQEFRDRQHPYIHRVPENPSDGRPADTPQENQEIGGITGALILDGWGLRGLLGQNGVKDSFEESLAILS